jgi:hypothetical protein
MTRVVLPYPAAAATSVKAHWVKLAVNRWCKWVLEMSGPGILGGCSFVASTGVFIDGFLLFSFKLEYSPLELDKQNSL